MIRRATQDDIDACMSLARALPAYFNDAGLRSMAVDLAEHELWVAEEAGAVVGFLAVRGESPQVAELSWMAIRSDVQGRGLGTGLVEAAAAELRERGFRLWMVKTLGPSEPYEPYVPTRAFYLKTGFLPLEEVNPYGPWGDGNPCLISARIL